MVFDEIPCNCDWDEMFAKNVSHTDRLINRYFLKSAKSC